MSYSKTDVYLSSIINEERKLDLVGKSAHPNRGNIFFHSSMGGVYMTSLDQKCSSHWNARLRKHNNCVSKHWGKRQRDNDLEHRDAGFSKKKHKNGVNVSREIFPPKCVWSLNKEAEKGRVGEWKKLHSVIFTLLSYRSHSTLPQLGWLSMLYHRNEAKLRVLL